jgi:5'-3' exonuclease
MNDKPLILIDCSYYIFYRYFATLKWYSLQGLSFNNEKLNQDYLDAFKKHVQNDLIKIKKKYKTIEKNIIFGLDCSREDIWRNEYHDNYKGKRITNINFNKEIFTYFKENLMNELNLNLLSGDNLEGDDVIAILHEQLVNKEKIIITNDNDYIQLIDKKTKIINMQFKDIVDRLEIELENHLILKALIGDKSDNIKKIGNINKKQAIELSKMLDNELKEWLVNNNLLKEFNNNIRLIDFKYIPEDKKINLLNKLNFIKE